MRVIVAIGLGFMVPVSLLAQRSKSDPSTHVGRPEVARAAAKAVPIGLSLRQVMGTIGDIELNSASSVHDAPRLMGKSRDGGRVLEVIGDPANVTQVMLMARYTGKPKNAWFEVEPIVRNCTPGLDEDDRDNWLRRAATTVMAGGPKQHLLGSAHRKVTLSYSKSFGSLMVVVTDASQ